MIHFVGFGGQKLQERSLTKLAVLKDWAEKHNNNLSIIIDGGVNEQTAAKVREAGANVLVAGSFLFRGTDLFEQSKMLLES